MWQGIDLDVIYNCAIYGTDFIIVLEAASSRTFLVLLKHLINISVGRIATHMVGYNSG